MKGTWAVRGGTAVFTVLRIWLGIQWWNAGINKIGAFDATGFLQGSLAKAQGEGAVVQQWYATFLEAVALPNVELFNILIPWGEVLVGAGLIIGLGTIPALTAAAFMNLNFLLAGTLSTNPMLLTAAFILLLAGGMAYRWGADRFLVEQWHKRDMRKRFFHKKQVA
ncbi:DoxX family membrane protein [Bacillaceae bacterium SIJ1]|uniref:DoxX family membrane protein n=1 Tax=Litoribacterium kuwaitense TaxID=1398745 RepID=UPI0013EC95C8|nr:DoxX family membrane protein [Litoribacterium kuwaitense]NGP46908.1 DoxX family membrane protein [Litoribacterium kuwaitense]